MMKVRLIASILIILFTRLYAQPDGSFRSYYTGEMDDGLRFQMDLTIGTESLNGSLSFDSSSADPLFLQGEFPLNGTIRLSASDKNDSTLAQIYLKISPLSSTSSGTWLSIGKNHTQNFRIKKVAEYVLLKNTDDFIKAEAFVPQFISTDPAWQQINLFLNDAGSDNLNKFVSSSEDRLVINKTNIFLGWKYRDDYLIRCYSDKFVSLLVKEDNYSVSGLPGTSYRSLNFQIADNIPKLISLSELFQPGSDYYKILSEQIIKDLRPQKASWIVNNQVNLIKKNDMNTFTLTPYFIEFVLRPGKVAPIEDDYWFARVPYSALSSILNTGIDFPISNNKK
ncbi:MAG: hypothetical protein ACM34K_12440 [Bacillota bacterium]